MTLSRPDALRTELRTNIQDRPFKIEFWDGSVLEPTDGVAGPSDGFRAHAWLETMPDGQPDAFQELFRLPAPAR